eukprot:11003168-Alexandrium_andersonii.AAC.1
MRPEEVERRKWEVRIHLDFAIRLCEVQLGRGARFLHEHPASATSWGSKGMQRLFERPEASSAIGHMCRFGMTT